MIVIVCSNCKSSHVKITNKELKELQCIDCEDIFNINDSIICEEWELNFNGKFMDSE